MLGKRNGKEGDYLDGSKKEKREPDGEGRRKTEPSRTTWSKGKIISP